MTATPDLDSRLQQHHENLIGLFTGTSPPVPDMTLRPRPRRLLLAAAALAVALAVAVPVVTLRVLPGGHGSRTLQVAGFTIVAAADSAMAPRMTESQAVAAVEAFWSRVPLKLPDGTAITGVVVHDATFIPDVANVTKPCIHVMIPQPQNLWVVSVSAPPQHGWRLIGGGYLVNDADGSLAGGDLLMTRQDGAAQC